MSKTTVAVLASYLLESGWHEESSGPRGSIWRKGRSETALPRELEVGSALWTSVVGALAKGNGVPLDEVAELLVARHNTTLAAQGSTAGPRARRSGSGQRVELELHLDGGDVTGHETGAYDFGRLVMRAADTVKELVKSSRGTRHHSRVLRVVGGPGEGSVSVVLREPDQADTTALVVESPETAEGQALVFLSTVLAAAEKTATSPEGGDLDPYLAPLTVGARSGLARLAEVVMDAGWTVDGTIRRGNEEAQVYLSLSGAYSLHSTARDNRERNRSMPVNATFDSWSWSRSELELITEEVGNIRVAVPMDLQEEAAALVGQQETNVHVLLEVFDRVTPDSGKTMATSYLLGEIRQLGDQALAGPEGPLTLGSITGSGSSGSPRWPLGSTEPRGESAPEE